MKNLQKPSNKTYRLAADQYIVSTELPKLYEFLTDNKKSDWNYLSGQIEIIK